MANDALDLGVMFSFRNPARWRRPFTDVYRDELDLIVTAEALGYDSIWLTEHHFVDDGYSPSILTIAAAIAARTERVRIGFNLLLLPLHNAVQLAEDIATLDILSNGRIDVGVGQGYAPDEFAGFQVPIADRLGRFREGLDVLNGLWTQESFSYEGTHYKLSDVRLSPRPVQQPAPPLWIGATSRPGVVRAGRRGAHFLGVNRRAQRLYEEARTAAGFDLDSAKALQLHWTHVADSDDAAWAEAAPHFHHLCSVYAGLLGAAGKNYEIPAEAELRSAKPVLFDPVFGSTATVTDKLGHALRDVRTTHLALGLLPGMAPAVTRRSMEQFVKDVAPALR
jgi:alkanesulfonate monooxygenase SsuD/methylene tetrahydromethanopterin reductase-like flavin-dependent oxidoreductase (luciferase family)